MRKLLRPVSTILWIVAVFSNNASPIRSFPISPPSSLLCAPNTLESCYHARTRTTTIASTTDLWSRQCGYHHRRRHHHHLQMIADQQGSDEKVGDFEDTTTTSASVTDWVVENLENGDPVTRASSVQAGENDTLPIGGLIIGHFLILPAAADHPNMTQSGLLQQQQEENSSSGGDDNNAMAQSTRRTIDDDNNKTVIRLLMGRNGWGTGVHPTTRLCLEWISQNVKDGQVVLDYGCGSGILSIAAFHQGAHICRGVDIEAEALITATRNVQLNQFGTTSPSSSLSTSRWYAYHTREVIPYGLTNPPADIVLANILIGQLVRPSMVAALTSNVRDGGWLCFSGIRPGSEVESLMDAYRNEVEFLVPLNDDGDDDKNKNTTTTTRLSCSQYHYYSELAALDCPGSLESYGFDCGTWAIVVGRKKVGTNRQEDILSMSEGAVQ